MRVVLKVLPLVGLVSALSDVEPQIVEWPSPQGSWRLSKQYRGSTFFDGFDFFTQSDPTHGCVNYVSKSTAKSNGLIWTSSSQAGMAVDSTNVYSTCARKSVRIESKSTYNRGLFILDVQHMPQGCGTWPAYWSYGPNWPNSGEIDVIEGVNLQTTDASTLHTNSGCNFKNAPHNFTGYWGKGTSNNDATDCYVNAPNEWSNEGCGIYNRDSTSYGAKMNGVRGGVMAHEWTSSGIRVWWWRRSRIPSDIKSGTPNPDYWGVPFAAFPFGSWCSSNHFQNHKIIFNIALCGDWAGATWGSTTCTSKASSCDNYAKNYPGAFSNAYWLINSLKVYQK